jgi:hypothetical protein
MACTERMTQPQSLPPNTEPRTPRHYTLNLKENYSTSTWKAIWQRRMCGTEGSNLRFIDPVPLNSWLKSNQDEEYPDSDLAKEDVSGRMYGRQRVSLVQGVGCGVWGLGSGVHGLGCRVWVAGFGVQGSGFGVQGSGYGVEG